MAESNDVQIQLSEDEMARRRAAYTLVTFGVTKPTNVEQADFDKRVVESGELSEQEISEIVFSLAVRRIVDKRETVNEGEVAIQRAYDAIDLSQWETDAPAVIAAQHEFIATVLIHFENVGKLPEVLRCPPGRDPASPKISGDALSAVYRAHFEYIADEDGKPLNNKYAIRSIPRINSGPFDGPVRIPSNAPVNGALTAIMSPKGWTANGAGDAVFTQVRDTQVAIDCDTETGLDTENIIHRIAKQGPALAQTFIAMVNVWARENKGKPYETYLTVRASDLLRAQGRFAPNGGFSLEEQAEKGRQVYTLFRLHVPRTIENIYGSRVVKKQSKLYGPLVIGQGIEFAESGDTDELVTFRFHLAGDVMDAVCGDKGEYAELSSRLLTYHPTKEKYQILLGFSLAYYDRVNRKQTRTHHPISLPALLNMACIEEPERNASRFLIQIETAINDLSRDGVIPGLRLEKPKDWAELLAAKKAREVLNKSKVIFPRMIQAPEPGPARIAPRNGAK